MYLRLFEGRITISFAFLMTPFLILIVSATSVPGISGSIDYVEWGGFTYPNISTIDIPDPSNLDIKKLSSKPPAYPWAQHNAFSLAPDDQTMVCVSQPGFCYYACRTWTFDVLTLHPDGSNTNLCLAQSSTVRREDVGFNNDTIMTLWPEVPTSPTKRLVLPSTRRRRYNLLGRYAYAFVNRYQYRATVAFNELRLPSGYCITGCDAVGMEYQTCQSMGLPDTGAAGRIKMDARELVFLTVTVGGSLYFGAAMAG